VAQQHAAGAASLRGLLYSCRFNDTALT
jgi:hypothetical protein